jgi:hypothetical protein
MQRTLFKQITDESLTEVMTYCKVLATKGYNVAISCGKLAGITATKEEPW